MSAGTEPTPVQVTPRHSNCKADNIRLVVGQLLESPLKDKVGAFLVTLDSAWDKAAAGDLQDHPITHAAKEVGADVHWIS